MTEEGNRLVFILCVPCWQYKIDQHGTVTKGEIATKDMSLYKTPKPLAAAVNDSTKRNLLMAPQRML